MVAVWEWAALAGVGAVAAPGILHALRRRAQRGTLDFNLADEAIHHLETDDEPWSVHVECTIEGHLDELRLRRAVAAAQMRHPMMRAFQERWRPWHNVYRWRIDENVHDDAVTVVVCDSADDVEKVRAALVSYRIPISRPPPFRVTVARTPDRDHVILNVSHSASDGIGSLRLLRSIAEAYASGAGDPAPDDLAARDLARGTAPASFGVWWSRQVEINRMLRRATLEPPTRIAVDTEADAARGVAFVLRRMDANAFAQRPKGTTINDALIAAQHLAIDRWNVAHGAARERISSMMPVNVRPKDAWFDVVSNIALFVTVSTRAEDRASLGSTTSAVAAQTRELKDKGTVAVFRELLVGSPALLLEVKRRMPSLLFSVGTRFIDTAVLSNLGLFPGELSFGDAGPAAEFWFSPPCRMPIGLGLGVATYAGTMFFTYRYRTAMWSATAAEKFADLFEETVRSA
jgi:NRPS condensation-like uncharacterized protein